MTAGVQAQSIVTYDFTNAAPTTTASNAVAGNVTWSAGYTTFVRVR